MFAVPAVSTSPNRQNASATPTAWNVQYVCQERNLDEKREERMVGFHQAARQNTETREMLRLASSRRASAGNAVGGEYNIPHPRNAYRGARHLDL